MNNTYQVIISGIGRFVKGLLLLPVIIVIALAMYVTQKKGKRTK